MAGMMTEPADLSAVGRRSKRKGKHYESRVAAILSEFTGINFRRVPNSGGWNKTGGLVVAKTIFCGDVLCDNSNFLYSVEAKNREDISLTALLKNPSTASLTKYWYQCIYDADSIKRKPMMFFKPNISDDWVCIACEDATRLGLGKSIHLLVDIYKVPISLKIIIRDERGKKTNITVSNITLPNFVILDWGEFIKVVKPELLFAPNI